jgi:hypothetical protein
LKRGAAQALIDERSITNNHFEVGFLEEMREEEMNSRKSIFLAVAAFALLLVAGASSAVAQTVTFNLATAPTFVANTGRSEVMGQVTLTADVICGTAADAICVSTAGTIQILYVGTPIDNTLATGITVCDSTTVGTCNAAGGYLTGTFTVTNTGAGGVVSVGVNGAIDFAAGRQITIAGVRGQIDQGPGNVVGTAITGQLTASPSTIAAFVPTQEVVARSADPLTITITAGVILQCRPNLGTATVKVSEGFNTAFVDHGDAAETGAFVGAPLNFRPPFGGTNNSRVNLVITNKPTGVTIVWPTTSAVDSGAGLTGAQLTLIVQSASGDTATYVYSTPNQALSDVNAEVFNIVLTAPANFVLTGTSADFGVATGQGQMYPPPTPFTQAGGPRPRYNHPLEPSPAATFLTVAPCTTNLLFPWVLNFAGYDTGIAIANTSADPYGTAPQTGTCTLNLFPTDKTTNQGVALAGPISVTTSNVQGGSVWRGTMSGTAAFTGQAGYIIAICRFQYGHGFAFITDNFGVGAPITAQGYMALLIPDPVILGGASIPAVASRRSGAANADDVFFPFNAPYGEGLGE